MLWHSNRQVGAYSNATGHTRIGLGPVQTVGCDECRTAAFAEAAAQTSRSESLEEMAALRTKLPFAAPAP